MRTQSFTRAQLGAVAAVLCVASVAGCDHLDPVKTESLCNDRNVVSMRCPQCQKAPYPAECSICSTQPDMCLPPEENPSTDPGNAGSGETDGAIEGSDGGGGMSGGSGAGGKGGGGGAGATGGRSGSGGGGSGGSSMGSRCMSDVFCEAQIPDRPACDTNAGVCVQCLEDSHCSGMFPVCNTTLRRCQNCVTHADCGGRQCDMGNMVCVDCLQDSNCTDEVKNQCDPRSKSCVDCVDKAGCVNQGELNACDPATFTCVDCLSDGDCTEDPGKRACDTTARTCIGCINDTHCAGNGVNSSCDQENHVCVDCTNDDGCGGALPRCETEAHKCVECIDGDDCASGHCVGNECVECEKDSDCPDADASHCDASNRCVGCTNTSQCTHLSATPACDTTARKCVECNDDTTCGNKACIRSTHKCSDVDRNSLDTCRPCQADSMCKTNMRCVPLSFGGSSYGTYCAFTQSSRSGGRCSNARPYSQAATLRSVDGSSQSYCIPPSSTTCDGVLDLTSVLGGITCASDNDCGRGIGDGNCNANNRCTYGCTADTDCPMSTTCLTGLTCG